ncbi:MAG: glycosyltransferase family 4 protein [Anaerolineae bacterium]
MDETTAAPAGLPGCRLHVGLNAQLLSTQPSYRAAGINVYIQNLLRHLPQVDGNYRYTAFLSDRDFPPVPGLRTRLTRLPTPSPGMRIVWEQVWQPVVLFREGVDLLHALAFVAPVACPCPFVVTVYDLSFLRFPQAFRAWNRLYLNWFTRHSARRARRVIAISESTRQDVVRLLGVSADRVDAIPCGVGPEFRQFDPHEVDRFRREKGLPERFFLFVGTLEPRKNLPAVFEAMRLLKRGGEPTKPCLVVVGGLGWGYQEALSKLEELDLEGDVLLTGFVPSEELPWWYNAATALVYPSLYEGFGLPALEAMACGLPVLTSDRGSLPEVVGEAGLLVDPEEPEGLAVAMDRLWREQDLRAHLSAQGLGRARRFSWDHTARLTVQTYERASGPRRN